MKFDILVTVLIKLKYITLKTLLICDKSEKKNFIIYIILPASAITLYGEVNK
jgi:hypothetical protein